METDPTEFVRLGDVLPRSYKNGIYKSAECYGHGVPILRITDFDNDGCLVTENLQKLELDEKEVSSYELAKNDIVVNRVNSLTHLGKAILWTDNTIKTVYESNMMRIEPDEAKVHPQYLIRILQSYEARVHFKKVAKRAVAQCSINQQDVKALRFRLPPLPEQKKIAQILSTWDKAITTTEQLLTNSQQQKKALMQQLLTGKKRLLDKNRVSFSGEWVWLKASELFKTVSKKNNAESEDLLAVTQDQGVLPRALLERRVVMPDGTTQSYKLVVPGNFIISLRSFQGGLEYSTYRGLVSPAYTVLAPIKLIDDGFYKQYYKSYDFIGHLAVAVIGIRDGKQISYEDFSFLKLPYPSIEEQQKIAAVLSTADQEITTLQQKLDALKQEKKALMQQLLTGKRRVNVEEAA
ncbi:restriction endonuclease subunit S [Pectobacterium aroidearum]|uniref:Restriction endonuclease subunit S n=1 Tax=Pectobacterium aroidearum TaxID=1201031 RepID=A0ABR5ZIJ8_9GAMM|nr:MULTISPECIES: restriction endonuclease subunit S [Pectobacterium]MBA5201616.1 restriction endonuclease subunit S [Pectobacterium aroidearum]MBA5229895.1 restriction endonuclease subunit S [Pectobacterium aroidearum]MBA5234405.1 restriction endonuclease subunit S [Pectobacterium aroidearum]MBA5739580.1 restriction endonuclease subunit S [Pectobacterium aroidearum]UXK00413.1 restriction endonuclease subunit S [Pectobacterium aroidearum]